MSQQVIDKLTPEQEAKLEDARKYWHGVGMCTDRSVRPVAETAITGMYADIQKPQPEFAWVHSPAAGATLVTLLRNRDWLQSSVGDDRWHTAIAQRLYLGHRARGAMVRVSNIVCRQKYPPSTTVSAHWMTPAVLMSAVSAFDKISFTSYTAERDRHPEKIKAAYEKMRADFYRYKGESGLESAIQAGGITAAKQWGMGSKTKVKPDIGRMLNPTKYVEGLVETPELRAALDELHAALEENFSPDFKYTPENVDLDRVKYETGNPALEPAMPLPVTEIDICQDCVVTNQNFKAAVDDYLRSAFWGQHEAYWVAYYRFCREVLGVQYPDNRVQQLQRWSDVAESTGWFATWNALTVCCERPTQQKLNATEVLSCENGPAVGYEDGWGVYAINGVRLNEQIVVRPQTLTLDQIKAEQNEEVKRIMIERFAGFEKDPETGEMVCVNSSGWRRYLIESGAIMIDKNVNDIEATRELLYRVDNVTVLVTYCPSTGRIYALERGPNMKTCEEAQKWAWNDGKYFTDLLGGKPFRIIGRT